MTTASCFANSLRKAAANIRPAISTAEIRAVGRTGVACSDVPQHGRCFVRGHGQGAARRQLMALWRSDVRALVRYFGSGSEQWPIVNSLCISTACPQRRCLLGLDWSYGKDWHSAFVMGGGMSEFIEERAKVIRSMASTADPFAKLRLLALAQKYESQLGKPSRAAREIQTSARLPPVGIVERTVKGQAW